MSEATSATSGNGNEVESNRDLRGDASAFLFSALSTPSGPGGLPLRPIFPPKSALKGHQRSASHGGVATRHGVAGIVARICQPKPILWWKRGQYTTLSLIVSQEYKNEH
ncbi:hypothetical protein RUM44_002633 [Polyplax serrata]|uniref:Uncharacterized protein n=1 Tax=Polyplax serrata TaxID=468196 RepID=A0ABR1AFA1_POLSC